MRRTALIAVFVWAAPHVAAAQATVGDAAGEARLPDADEAATSGADEAPTEMPRAEETEPAETETDGVAFIPAPESVPESESTPLLESWWFWMAIGAVVLGITAAVVVDVTTDDPAPSPRDPEEAMTMGLVFRL